MDKSQTSNIIRTFVVLSIFLQLSLQMALAEGPMQQKAGVNNSNNNFLTYENPTHGVRIRYPPDWQKIEHLSGNSFWIDFTSPSKSEANAFPATVSVSVKGLNESTSTTIRDYLNGVINKAKQSLPDFQIIEPNRDTNITGTSASKIVYSFLSQDPVVQAHFQSMNIWTIKDKKVYGISYTEIKSLYPTYLPTVQKMIDSFEVIK
jgi:eukaryotic-like serine/threonine-protein kinase